MLWSVVRYTGSRGTLQAFAQTLGFYLEDRFDMATNVRPQRTQKRTRSNYSSLLVLRRGRNYRQTPLLVSHGSPGCSDRDVTSDQDVGDKAVQMGARSLGTGNP